ncbi:MAG: hypothetical protein ACI9YH_004346 [Colwellia sp.]|jgi:hypothetical protein
MEFSTPNAIRQIKANTHKQLWVEGHKQCPLQAMSFAFNYHTLNIVDSAEGLSIQGIDPVSDYRHSE